MKLLALLLSAALAACYSYEETSAAQGRNVQDTSCSELKKQAEAIASPKQGKSQSQPSINYENDRYQKALAVLTSGLDSCASDVGFLLLMSDVYMSLGDNNNALKYAEEALSQDQYNALENHSVGNLLILTGDYTRGLEYLKKSVSLDSTNQLMKFNLCSSLELVERYNEAVEICSQLVEAGFQKGPALFVRGRSYEALGMQDKARKDYDEAKQLGHELLPYYSEQHLNNP